MKTIPGLHHLLAIMMVVSVTAVFAQPANDNCTSATNLGALPTPAACPSGVGSAINVSGTTVNATASNPYYYLLGCQTGGNQTPNALDVWYSFTATGNLVTLNLSGTIPSPNVALWTGTCGSLTGYDCAVGNNAGSLTVTFQPTTPGQTYLLQISGNNTTASGTFNFTLNNDNDCSNCLQTSSLTVNPPPTNGTYLPGTTVNFCYTISSYTQVSANWLHGVVPSFGCGWNLASLTPGTLPADCAYDPTPGPGNAGAGSWNWFNSVTSSATGLSFGPGFFFDNVNVTGTNPGQNFGDPTNGNCTWVFCWSITTSTNCSGCKDLSVSINTLADGESGSWTSIACSGDPEYQFSSTLACCQYPNITVNNVSCFGQCNASATVVPVGTASPWDYTWTGPNGLNTTFNNLTGASNLAGLCAGNYTVTVNDNNNCAVTSTFSITQPISALTASASQGSISCNGGTTTATVTPSGGTAPYTYAWSPSGGTGPTSAALTAGSYVCTVTDANGCTIVRNITLTQPSVITATSTQGSIACNGGTTTASVTPSGGVAPYTFSWSPIGGNGFTSTALTAGNYACTVTDANGCTVVRNITLTQPSAITATSTQGIIACNGGTSTATVSPSGGTTPYTYAWSPSGGTGATSAALVAGSYNCTITDANGCTMVRNITITQPSALSATSSQGTIACNGETTTATVTPTGGTSPYTYAWSPSGGTGATSSVLVAGSYNCTITDANGCTTIRNITITQPALLSASGSSVPASCNTANGSATVVASGGATPYTYAWSPIGGSASTATGLSGGNYSVTVTDANGCTSTASVVVVSASSPVATISAISNVSCNGGNNGSVSLSVSGGSAPYSYNWSPSVSISSNASSLAAGNYTVTVTGANGCTTSISVSIVQPTTLTASTTQGTIACNGGTTTAAVIPNGGTSPYAYAWSPSGGTGAISTAITAGSYTCTITDANGCMLVRNITITHPAALGATSSIGTIACNGGTTTATINLTGGTSPYAYVWSPIGGTGATSTALTAGSYTCTITDANGCTILHNITLSQPSALSATSTQGTILCNGGTTTAAITPTGGTSPYAYAWSPSGGTGSTSNPLTVGSYNCTITDANGCTALRNITLTQPSAISTTSTQGTIACNGGATTATVTPSGGTSPYTYAWSPMGGLGATSTALSAGSYSCAITDANGCTAVRNITLTQPAALSATSTQGTIACNGGTTTSTITPNGGTAPYTYAWSPSGGTGAISAPLTSGNYGCTITDLNGCTFVRNITLSQPNQLSASVTAVPSTCNTANGSATVVASGGTAPYSYAWSPIGGTGSTASGLNAGTYSVLVTDANGCTASSNVVVTSSGAPLATVASVVNASCNGGNNGSASLSITGGVLPYGFAWSPAVSSTSSASNLSAGNYTVIVSGSNGCTSTVNITIAQPAALNASNTQGIIACNGGTATSTVTPSGGTSPYAYAWSPIGGTAAISSALTAGNYSCTITDANGCTVVRNITITQPSALVVTGTQGTIACNGGTATATVTPNGGISPYSYAWSPIGGTASTSNALTAGSYGCTITDANGCTAVRNFTLLQPSALSATNTQGTILCNGGTTTATITPNGGTSPYAYAWSPIGGTGSTSAALTAGSYSCTITDANGCTTVRNITLTHPSALSATSTQGTIACNGGTTTATVIPTGGTSPYAFAWSPMGGTGATSSALSAGSYNCTVTDANGCTTVRNITLTQPSALSATSAQGNISCNGGTTTVTVNPVGGTAPFTFTWSPTGGTGATSTALIAGSYSCTITDANGCTSVRNVTLTQPSLLSASATSITASCGLANGSATAIPNGGTPPYTYLWSPSGTSTATSTGLMAGTYTVTITDFNGCTATATTNVVNVGSPNLSITNVSNVSCFGSSNGSASVVASGGVGPYSYSWTPSGGNATSANALTAGGYTVLVTGANGCTASISLSITQPPQIALSASSTNVSCFGGANGSASISAIGGTAPYSYSWSGSIGSTASMNNLQAGNYSCLVTDAQGCTAAASTSVSQPTALSVSINTTNVLCFNGASGTATAIVSGGVPSYQYAWSGNISTNASVSGLSAQSYNCTVTDANGCTQTQSFTIGQPTPLQSSVAITDAHCGQSDGSITLNTSGGIQPYAYSWSPSGSGSTLVNIAAGIYQVTITDLNGCTTSTFATVVDLPGVLASLGSTSDVTCFGGADGTATVLTNGGSIPYSYNWSPNVGSTSNVIGLSAGVYQVTVTDANGCSSIVGLNITEPPQLVVNTSVSASNVCPGVATSLTAIGSGGLPNYNYVWSPGNISGSLVSVVPQTSTNYTVLVTDANGCTQVGSAYVNVAPLPQAIISADINSACAPVCVQFSDYSTVSSPGFINSWSWNFGDGTTSTNQNPSHCFDNPGSYDITLTVITSDGCLSTLNASDYIHVNNVPTASFEFSPTSPDAFYPQVSFLNNSVGASSWLWNFGDLNGSTSIAENPSFLFPDTSCFTVSLIATSDSGCVDTTSEIVCIKPVVAVYVPNAFTPNGDGVNDLFYPVCIGLMSGNYSFWIYDRWGQNVFFADKPLVGWDGKYADSRQEAQMDAYVWRLSCKDFEGRIVTKSGRVTLVR